MNRARALAALNGRMLQALSRRTTDRLRAALPLRVALPHVEPFLALNVDKEIRKDALVFACAAEALAAGCPLPAGATSRLLEETKRIDHDFLSRIGRFPVRIAVPYEHVLPLRRRRIDLMLEGSYRVLEAWRPGRTLRAALPGVYPEARFQALLLEVLALYAREIQALSHSVRLPLLVAPLRERLARALLDLMTEASTRLSGDITRALYRQPPPSAR
jgi:hypothetical protein